MGTIGGNIANGSPIGDTPPALIALGASEPPWIASLRNGERRELPLEAFFLAYGKQDRSPASSSRPCWCRCLRRRPCSLLQDLQALRRGYFGRVRGLPIWSSMRRQRGERAHRLWRHGRHAEARQSGGGGLAGEGLERGSDRCRAIAGLAEDFQPLTDMRASAAYRL
jgi:xanthine dehydrogenase small subunit